MLADVRLIVTVRGRPANRSLRIRGQHQLRDGKVLLQQDPQPGYTGAFPQGAGRGCFEKRLYEGLR